MRQPRSDSPEVAVQAAQNAAAGLPKPPAHVRIPAKARPFWDALMQNRPRHRWNDADLATAAMLARAQFDVERHERAIAKEGDLIEGSLNPRFALIDKLGRRIMGLSRLLHVHPEATQGRAREQGNALDAEQRAKEAQAAASSSNVHRLIRRS